MSVYTAKIVGQLPKLTATHQCKHLTVLKSEELTRIVDLDDDRKLLPGDQVAHIYNTKQRGIMSSTPSSTVVMECNNPISDSAGNILTVSQKNTQTGTVYAYHLGTRVLYETSWQPEVRGIGADAYILAVSGKSVIVDTDFKEISTIPQVVCICHSEIWVTTHGYYNWESGTLISDIDGFVGWLDVKRNLAISGISQLKGYSGKRNTADYTTVYTIIEFVIDDTTCCVCMAEFEHNRVCLVPCGHTRICVACADKCVKCPICRSEINIKQKMF